MKEYWFFAFFTIIILLGFANTAYAVSPQNEKKELSPNQQYKLGIAIEDVKCNHGLQIVIKLSNNHPVCVKPTSIEKLVRWGWAKVVESVQPPISPTGNLLVYILPYPTDKEYHENTRIAETIKSLVKTDTIPYGVFGASKLGQYDNKGNIVKSSESVKIIIYNNLKKPDGKVLNVSDISEQMLFGNSITIGGVLLNDGSTVDATIMVVDSSFESDMNSIIDQLANLLSG